MQSTKPKTLLIITPGFPKNEADTTCIPPQQVFVKALKEVNPGLNIIVLTLTYPFVTDEYEWHGIKVISFGNKNKGRLFRVAGSIKMWLALAGLNKQYEIIGLLSFWLGKCASIADKFAKKNNLKHYCWLLGQDAKPGNKYVKKIKPQADSLIAISDFVSKQLNTNYGILPAHVIPVGVDATMFTAAAAVRDIDILGAGSLIPLKQYSVFLEMVKCLKYYSLDIKAIICGDGPEKDMLAALINTMGLEDNISLAGELAHTEVLALMQRSKVLLHPSNYEGFSTVCLEALYAGAQVLSFIRPMETDIHNWHIATNKEDMLEQLATLLRNKQATYESVMPYAVHDSARAITKLFHHNAPAMVSNSRAIASNESFALK
jgi:glycosyltransferase involved in cell wall biosynthesis